MSPVEKAAQAVTGSGATASLVKAAAKPLIKMLGDKMETAKRPFWRKLVRAFRGEPL